MAAGLGTLLGGIGLGGTVAAGYLGVMAASAPLVGGLFGAYGGKLTGEMMKRYAQEVSYGSPNFCSFPHVYYRSRTLHSYPSNQISKVSYE